MKPSAQLAGQLASAMKPVEVASGLPNCLSIDQQGFELEIARIFKAGWVGIGLGKDVPDAGDG